MNTVQLLGSLFFVALIGFISGKLRLFDENARKALIKFVFYIATSALLIQAVLSINIHDAGKYSKFTVASIVLMSAVYIATYMVLRVTKMKYKSGASVLYAGNVSNNIYLGLPFIKVLYGTPGLIYAAVLIAVPLTLSDIVDFYLLSSWKNSKTSIKTILLDFIKNPVVISIFFGAMLLALDVHLPQIVDSGLSALAGSATGLALFAMGLFVSLSSWKHFSFKLASLTTLIKLIVVPTFIYLGANYLFQLSGLPLNVMVMMSAFPSAIFCMVVASEYEFDERATADAIILSSILFIGTSLFWTHLLK